MANLKTPNVFIDTEVFDAGNLNFQSTSLTELIRLVRAGVIKVFSTTITKAEIEAHITERIQEALPSLERFRDKGRIFRNLNAFKSAFATLEPSDAVNEIKNQFSGWLKKARVRVLDIDTVRPEVVFKRYFNRDQPFGNDKKKYEFPDAFVQERLRSWCSKNHAYMYVVSADPDWLSLDENDGRLIAVSKLQEVIDLALKDEQSALSENALELFRQHFDFIKERIISEFTGSSFYLEDEEGEVEEVRVQDLDIGEPFVVELTRHKNQQEAVINISCDFNYEADVEYEDQDSGIWDSEDKRWVFRETKSKTVEEEEHGIDAQITLTYDPKHPEDCDIDVEFLATTDFAITVQPTAWELK